MDDWMILLSGPLAQRGPLLATLNRAGVLVRDRRDSWGLHGDKTTGWITCHHSNVDDVVEHAKNAGWRLRAHRHTPEGDRR